MNIPDSINTKADFIRFIGLLIEDLKNNPTEWENKTLPDFLDAMANWTEDMDGYYINHHLPVPTTVNWQVFANILAAARIYE
ncbi:MAG: hypothetical protein J7623_07955 [Chitinophaga sp.]|uniref:DUF7660 family protein n=1 Tax=Chitinophaga sp. TaxID=1869181 RepID=UPI001B0057F2|nr:hypothetical protein [Chitinophaga sp.]MBO9728554.1 hypothetical protein [Chitinophaga sp.]